VIAALLQLATRWFSAGNRPHSRLDNLSDLNSISASQSRWPLGQRPGRMSDCWDTATPVYFERLQPHFTLGHAVQAQAGRAAPPAPLQYCARGGCLVHPLTECYLHPKPRPLRGIRRHPPPSAGPDVRSHRNAFTSFNRVNTVQRREELVSAFVA
jgi:hypothetical protein